MGQFLRLHPWSHDEGPPPVLAELGFEEWCALPGTLLAQHRTGHVMRIDAAASPLGLPLVRKVYDYPTPRDRRRGLGRNTWLARSRASREGLLLQALAERGLQPYLAVAVGNERDGLGVLRRCFLVTRWWESRPLDRILAEPGADRARVLRALPGFVARLHAAGFLDRDLHLRNLLWNGQALAKIDCPRGSFLSAGWHSRRVGRDLTDLGGDLGPLVSQEERRRLWLRYRRARRRAAAGRAGSTPAAPACPGGRWPVPR